MTVTFERVKLGKEVQKQVMIQDLYAMGITEYQNHSLEDLDFYTLRTVLAAAKIRVESSENGWF